MLVEDWVVLAVLVVGSDSDLGRGDGTIDDVCESAEKVDDVASVVKLSQRFVFIVYTEAHH